MTKRIMNVMLICLILLSVVTVRGQFVEGRNIQRSNDNQSLSLSEQEIANEISNKFKSPFLENQGQLGNEEIIFYGSLPNGKIAFGESKAMLWMEGMNCIITLKFIGAQEVLPIGIKELMTKSNYFLGNRGTYTDVKSYGAILYSNLWNGIDLYYQATSKGVKYEFRVAPGAKPEDISIQCEDQEQLIIGKDTLTILKGNSRFIDEGLKVLQDDIEIDAKFVSKGNDIFGFQLSEYDKTKSLIIDPLLYSTFVGGNTFDYGHSMALDSEGNAYVTGRTYSYDFPTTANTYNRTHSGALDCFVFKLAADGSSLLYSTFVGGMDDDSGDSIALDSEENVYVTGYTKSTDFPTSVGAFNESFNMEEDCFVFKLSANGSSLLYSTFVGGMLADSGSSITLDSEGNAYVTGHTDSFDFPTTVDAFDESFNGGDDCFVFKLSANGSSLLYSTFIGGSNLDYGVSIALDNEGNTYVTGSTGSSDYPTTENVYNRILGGYRNCFVFKLSTDGSSLLYSTFVGGSSEDSGNLIALDNEGDVYVTGYTDSDDFPTTTEAYDKKYNRDGDCFVFKLSTDGSSLLYSTFVGGNWDDKGFSISFDNQGNAYVTGSTQSSDFPTTENAYSRTHVGSTDCFVIKLSVDGSSLLYSTFIGGSSDNFGYSMALDSERNVYVTGSTGSSDFPTTVNAYDQIQNGGKDCFVFKLLFEDVTQGIGLPTIGSITLTFSVLIIIATIIVIIPQRRRRK